MKRFLRLAAVLALMVMTTGVAGAQTSGSPVAVTAVGWWTSNPTATAPARGLAVSAGPNGTTISQGAIRFSVSATSLDRASLVLKEEGGVGASGGALQVCPTTDTWTPVEKGDLAAAPPPECARGAAPLARAASGDWTADVSFLLRGASGSVSLAVVPAGAGAVPVGFEVRFLPPRIDAAATPATTTTTTSTTPPSSSSEVASPPSSSSGSSSFSPPPTSPLPSFGNTNTFIDGDGAQVATPPPEPTGVPAVDENAVGPAPIRRVATPVSTDGGSRVVQALFFLVVSTVIGVGVGVGHARFRPAGATA